MVFLCIFFELRIVVMCVALSTVFISTKVLIEAEYAGA